jgi:hypothetical protein
MKDVERTNNSIQSESSGFLYSYVIGANFAPSRYEPNLQRDLQVSTNPYCLNQPENNQLVRIRTNGASSSLKIHFFLRNGMYKPVGFLIIDNATNQILYRIENSVEYYEETVDIPPHGARSITIKPTSSSGDYFIIYSDSKIFFNQ